MSSKIDVKLTAKTLQLLEEFSTKEVRNKLIDEAVQHYIALKQKEKLLGQLKLGGINKHQSAQLVELITLRQIMTAVLGELLECGFTLPSCLDSISSFLSTQGFSYASKLVKNAAIEVEQTD